MGTLQILGRKRHCMCSSQLNVQIVIKLRHYCAELYFEVAHMYVYVVKLRIPSTAISGLISSILNPTASSKNKTQRLMFMSQVIAESFYPDKSI